MNQPEAQTGFDSGSSKTAIAPSPRLRSLDALRGFDMLWIVGGSTLAIHLANYTNWQWLQWYAGQLQHAPFIGFKLLDLVFPLFLFIAGVAVPYSLGRRLEQGTPKLKLLRKTFVRAALLVLFGTIYDGLLEWKPLESTRFGSVLSFIGIAYFFAVFIYLYSNTRHQIIWAIGILMGYWAALVWIQVPGHGAGVLTPEGAITGFVDRAFLPGKFNTPHYNSQGILVHIPAIVTALLGILTGTFLRNSKLHKVKNAFILLAAGIVFWGLGKLWGVYLPISKELWNSSFVVYCAAWCLVLLSLFYLIIDALGYWRWSFFFIVIGMNSITIYLGVMLINFHHTSNFIFGGLIRKLNEPMGAIASAVAYIFVWWVILYFMYRRKIFLKV